MRDSNPEAGIYPFSSVKPSPWNHPPLSPRRCLTHPRNALAKTLTLRYWQQLTKLTDPGAGAPICIPMLEALVLAFALQQPATMPEYESPRCPGEAGVGFVTTRPGLWVYARPDRSSSRRRVPFQTGWRVAFDECRARTLKGIDISTTAPVDATCGDDRVRVEAGTTLRYLQYEGEGWGAVRVNGRVCSVDLSRRGFAGVDSQAPSLGPITEAWIRVIHADRTLVGWLPTSPSASRLSVSGAVRPEPSNCNRP